MEKSTKLNLLGQLLLLLATIAWGTSFFVLKETIEEVPQNYVLAIRFLLASGILAIIFNKNLKTINKITVKRGVTLGVILVCAYVVQTWGLRFTTPSRNAFLTAIYCVISPFLVWLMLKVKPKAYNLVSAFLCIAGVGFVSFAGGDEGGLNTMLGDGLTLIGAVFYSLQIIFIDKYQTEGHSPSNLLIVELLTVGIVCTVLSLTTELPFAEGGFSIYKLNLEQFLKILYLTVACTAFAQFAQMFGQKHASPNQASLILSLEAVFGTLFSVIFGIEKLTLGLIVGFIVIFVAIMVTEFKVDFSKLLGGKKSIDK
ncbi:MAG: DMT family transporter [Clostridia bacterium]|nr:DMT family transporter [Clostridia bacterium]